MDNRQRFLYHRGPSERSGDTEGQTEHAVGRACPSVKAGFVGKSAESMLRRDGVTNMLEAVDFTLSRKAASEAGGGSMATCGADRY